MLDGGSPRSDRDTGCHDPSRGWRMGVAVLAVGGPGWKAAAVAAAPDASTLARDWWMGVVVDGCRRAGDWRCIYVVYVVVYVSMRWVCM